MDEKRKIAILGSTGSIGTQALDVVAQHPDCFSAELLTANNNADLLIRQALEFRPKRVVICNPDKYPQVRSALAGTGVEVLCGMDAICDLVREPDIDMVLTAFVGFSGLRPTVSAITAGKPIALANKETLVAGGAFVMPLAREHGVPILPVDSEHSAIFQCLQGAAGNRIRRIHLTASGGPFRTWSRDRIAQAPASAALKHPRWDMGAKITIDSATLMNKGFEMIEARWLFDTAPSDIHILVHPQSIIHSMVEFEDGAVVAQLGVPDMRCPIQYALSYPRRLPLEGKRLDFVKLGSLTFEDPDFERFPCLGLAFEAVGRGGTVPCAMNAANEAAVWAYLHGRIAYYDIPEVIRSVMDETPFQERLDEHVLVSTHEAAYNLAMERIASLQD